MSSWFSPRSRTHQTSIQPADSPVPARQLVVRQNSIRQNNYITDQQLFPGTEHSLHCPSDHDLVVLHPSLGVRENNPARKQPSCLYLFLPLPSLPPAFLPLPSLPPSSLPSPTLPPSLQLSISYPPSLQPSLLIFHIPFAPLSFPLFPPSLGTSFLPFLPPSVLPFLFLSHCFCLLHDLSNISPSTSNEGAVMLKSNIQTQVHSRVVVRVTCRTNPLDEKQATFPISLPPFPLNHTHTNTHIQQ